MALTLTASAAGLEIVDRARKQKGYNKTNAVNWLEAAKVSRSSLDKFWARQPIKHENFVAICTAVGIDWQTVVDEIDNSRQPAANKLDDFNGLKIAKQIHDWLTALRYEFEAHKDFQPEYCEFIIRIPVRRGRFDRILIRGIQSEAKIRDLQGLQSSVASQQTDEGWLIVNRRISPAVQTELAKDENQHLSCMTFDELIDQDADFEPYLEWLEEEVIKRGIDRKYVSLACDKEEIDPVTQHSIATSKYGEAEGWIEGYIKQWLSDDSKEHVSILGEFGTGKTWFSFHYAWDCLRAYKEAKEQGLERPRLPLVIALRDYNKALKVESVLSDLFFNKHDIRLNSSVFDCLNQMGKLVIIFDGFDEMADKVDRQKMINNFWELARVVCPGSKVILTSRTEHFPHDRESRQLLNAELESSTAKLKWESPRFELLELAKFNEAQIRQVLTLEAEEKGLSTDIVEKVMVRAELLDLARRPVMTELIIEAMPEIEAGKPVDMSRIYYYAIVRKMDRDIKAERTFTSLADKLYFLCEIAWEMLSTERMKLNYREFPDRIRQIFPQLVTEAKDLDHWHYDMMGQTILIRNADGDYTPAHRSLLEFLVAYKFAAEAGVLKADFVAAVRQQTESCIDGDAIPQFYTWTGYLQACVAAKYEGKKIASLQGFIPESSEYLRDTFGHEPLTKAVIDLIVPMLDPTSLQPLRDLIHSTKNKTEQETGWVGGNAATILVKQNPITLNSEDLSYSQMANSNLVGANLQQVNFMGTNLSNSLFTSVLPSEVLSIAISQDGQLFATGHKDGKARLWNGITRQLIHVYSGHESSVLAIAIEPNNRWMLTGSSDKTIKRWDVFTNQHLCTYKGHQDVVKSVAISPKGDWIISGSFDKTIKKWDVLKGKCLSTYYGHQHWIYTVAISMDGNWFVSGSNDKTLKKWGVSQTKCLQTYSGHTDTVYAVAISPNGEWVVSGSYDKTLIRWNTQTTQCVQIYREHKDRINTIAIASNGKYILSGSNDKTVKQWSTDRNRSLSLHTYSEHQHAVNAVAISPDGSWFLTSSFDKILKYWDVNTRKCLQTYTGVKRNKGVRICGVVTSRNDWFISWDFDNVIKRWDIRTGKCLQTYIGHEDAINSVALSSDGKWFITASADKTIKHWDTFTGYCTHTYIKNTCSINVVAIFRDSSNQFISFDNKRKVKQWSIQTGECLKTFHNSHSEVLAFSMNGAWIAVMGNAKIDLLNMSSFDSYNKSSRSISSKYIDYGSFRRLAVSPDGHWLVGGMGDDRHPWQDNIIKRWYLNGDSITNYVGHSRQINVVEIEPNGSWFVSGSNDKTLRRWDSDTGKCLNIYTGHENSIDKVSISFDGYYLISCGDDEMKIWEVDTGKCIRTISDTPCAGMRIGGAIGLTSGQIESLKALGAVDD